MLALFGKVALLPVLKDDARCVAFLALLLQSYRSGEQDQLFCTTMLGNLALMSLARSATLIATCRATLR